MGLLCRDLPLSYASNEEDLLRQAHTGSARATEQLLARYRPLVESKARTYFLLGADHDDVVQEGMIGLYKAIRDFRDDRVGHIGRFRAFADLCVTRQIITAVKTATRQKHLPLNACISLDHAFTNDFEISGTLLDCLRDSRLSDPEDCLFQRHDSAGRLDAVRHTLSPLEARVLDLYLQGKSYHEISAELRCPLKSVDNALQRIKRKISETLLPD
ncbi:MAG TPA: RNA polymerase sporulation sigma factor SigH [Chthonomonadaceae bacterium]|nr:RNA polymerase sporulation sigma factor SigH [Chthonomonadaceae bacterium]